MKDITAPAGQRTEILRPLKGQAKDVIFAAIPHDGTDDVSGKVEESKRVIAATNSTMHELKAENTFRIGMMDHNYSLAVIPDKTVTIRFYTKHKQVSDLVKWIAIGVGGAVLLSLFFRLTGGSGGG